MSARCVIITRPMPEAEFFANLLRQKKFEPFIEPMLAFRALPFDLPHFEDYAGLIFTSAQALRALPHHFEAPAIPVFTVGDATAQAARARGFSAIHSAQGDVHALAALIKTQKTSGKPYLYMRGADIAKPLSPLMAPHEVQDLVVYEMTAAQGISPACYALLKNKNAQAVTFFSSSSARIFVNLIEQAGLQDSLPALSALCISPAVLDCVGRFDWRFCSAIATPDMKSMITALDDAFR